LTDLLGAEGTSLCKHGTPLGEIIICSTVGLIVVWNAVLNLDRTLCRLLRCLWRLLGLRWTRPLLLLLVLLLLLLLWLLWLSGRFVLLLLQSLLLTLHGMLLLLLELLLR
jgi:hypothetical protein